VTYRVVQKVSRYQIIKNRIKSHYIPPMRLDLFVKVKYQSSTIILSVGVLDITICCFISDFHSVVNFNYVNSSKFVLRLIEVQPVFVWVSLDRKNDWHFLTAVWQ